jgi:hypothetical protein
MDGEVAFNAIFLIGAVILLIIIAWAIPVRLWIEAISAGREGRDRLPGRHAASQGLTPASCGR